MGWRHYEVRAAGTVPLVAERDASTATAYEIGFVDTGRSKVFVGYFVRLTLDTEGEICAEDEHSFFRALHKLAALLDQRGLKLICAGTDPRWAESGLSFNSGWGYLPDHDAPVHIMQTVCNKESRMIAHNDDRYLSHMEDQPGFRTTRHRTVEEASQATVQRVTEQLGRNGCGDGLVYDRHEGKIVAIYGHTLTMGTEEGGFDHEVGVIAFPDEDALAEMTTLAAAGHPH